jgi:hypothetical protein
MGAMGAGYVGWIDRSCDGLSYRCILKIIWNELLVAASLCVQSDFIALVVCLALFLNSVVMLGIIQNHLLVGGPVF